MYNARKTMFISIISALLLFVAGCSERQENDGGTPSPLTKFSLKLHWIPDAHQLGFWVALDKGFYKQHGLEMTIYSGGMDANPIRDVINGSADIGQVGGVEQVIYAVNEGLPIKAIAAIHRRTPHALISLKGNPIRKASDIEDKTIAVAHGDTAEILLNAYIDAEGVPKESVKMVPFRYDLTPLLLGEVDAVTGFSTGQPITIKEKGEEPVVLSYEDAGITSYGYTLVASTKILKTKSSELKAFLAATRKGWGYAFANPDEAAELFKAHFNDTVDVERTKAELRLIKSLMLDEEGSLSEWRLDRNVVEGARNRLAKYSKVKKTLSIDSVYDNSYLNE